MASAPPTPKAGWEVKTLGEVCVVDWGNTELTKKSYVDEGKFLGVSAAGCDGRINHAEHKKHTPVLSAIGAQCGRMFFPEEDFTAIKNTITLTPVETETRNKFLFYLLTSVELPKRGAAQPFISKGDIQSFEIPLPPLPEQERIVGILDEAFEGIAAATAQAEKNLHNARELFQSVLQSTFSQKGDDWVETTLGECIKLKSGDGLTAKNMVKEGDFNVYGGNGVNGRHNKFNLDGEQVIVGRVGAHCGNVHYTSEKIWLTDNAFRVTDCIHDFDFQFLTQVLRVANLRESARQAAQPVISNTSVKDVEISFPKDIPTQQAIVEKLDALSEETKALEAIYERKQSALAELKQSLLQKAFAGEL